MAYTLKSEVSARKEVLRIGRQIERWCRENMGVNGRKKYDPTITYYKSLPTDSCMGEYRYWDNELIIYYNNCKTIKDLICTIVHEWQHQLQPMSKYEVLDDEHGYDDNPLEIEAVEAELRYYKPIWIAIKPKLNKIRVCKKQ
jgi:hypothetical protein